MGGRLRLLGIALVCAVSVVAGASNLPKRVLLIPLDDRPAAGQFAQMIGEVAGVQIETPPAEVLGRFLTPGKPELILAWLEKTGMANYDAVVVSMDMIAYGSLIASRADRSSYNLAIKRIRDFWRIRKQAPETRVYAFSAVMRLAPTATKATAAWRLQLARYAEVKERYRLSPSKETLASLRNLQAKIPAIEIQRYESIRDRNNRVQQELIRMTHQHGFDYLLFGQDDAQPIGPHVPETQRLRTLASNLGVGSRVAFGEGIDQHSNVLISRALLTHAGWTPRVRIVFADDQGRAKVAMYESAPVDKSLSDQLLGSGARPALAGEQFDYSLYVNTPEPRPEQFQGFLQSLKSEIDQGFPVAVADINLGKTGTGDPALFEALMEGGRSKRLLGYAGWNTAGNTMGTTIPAANVYLLARKENVDPLVREVGLRRFLLHRLVNDFEYHKFVRPQAYAMIDSMPRASREETYGPEFARVNSYVQAEMAKRLQDIFAQQILGSKFYVGSQVYEITNLHDVQVQLPWPRAYEVKLEFSLQARPEGDVLGGRIPILPLSGGRR